MKRTPLFAAHQKLGGKLIEFGGWEMPVQYSSITGEHLAVRKQAGLFDISHMGEVFVNGPGAEAFLNRSLTNDARKLTPGQCQYTLMCNPQGGVIDDLYSCRLAGEQFLLVINAARIDADFAWLQSRQEEFPESGELELKNVSAEYGAVAVQGPRVVEFINEALRGPFNGGTAISHVSELKKNQIARGSFHGKDVWISRTGYTGEDGFEIVAPEGIVESIWNRLLDVGRPHGLIPAGLGARDTLRLEVCYPLYGHELDEETTPIDAGLGFFVSLEKGEFTGRSVLAAQKAYGTRKKLVAFKMSGKSAPPRAGYGIWAPGGATSELGKVTSGTQSPSLGEGIGMGYVPPEFAKAGTAVEIEIRGRRFPAMVVAKPFYRKTD